MRAPLFLSGSRLPRLCTLIVVAAVLPSCTLTDDASGESVAPPEVQALFSGLQPATPDRLRGVWSIKTTNNDGEADLRMRFADAQLTVGTRCVVKAAPDKPVLAGKTSTIQTTDLDGKTGIFDLGESINVTQQKDGISCTGRFDKATWKFVITGTTLDMDPIGLQGQVHLDKVGD